MVILTFLNIIAVTALSVMAAEPPKSNINHIAHCTLKPTETSHEAELNLTPGPVVDLEQRTASLGARSFGLNT